MTHPGAGAGSGSGAHTTETQWAIKSVTPPKRIVRGIITGRGKKEAGGN